MFCIWNEKVFKYNMTMVHVIIWHGEMFVKKKRYVKIRQSGSGSDSDVGI